MASFTNLTAEAISESNRPILSDEPRISSAALCITLHHHAAKNSFRPEFTHQCVAKETFQGYQPLQSVLDKTAKEFPSFNETLLLHQSHMYHEQTSNELDIQIHLSPSCRQCKVHINVQPKGKRKAGSNEIEPKIKKQKSDKNVTVQTVAQENGQSTSSTALNTGISVPPVLTKQEIKDSIASALPEITESEVHQDYLSEPIGKVLTEYSVKDQKFVLSFADGNSKQVSEYHNQVQKLALWFIENADDVDVLETESGFWKVLYLFQKETDKYALVGYTTLFHFHSPFHKPNPGIIVRICQALVFPSYQGQGHGKRMMKCVYDLAHEKHSGCYEADETIVQVNVEDPAPGFVALRNKADLKLITDNYEKLWPSSRIGLDISNEKFFESIPDSEAVGIGALAKITPHQIHITNEFSKLQQLLAHEGTSADKEELERRYRLLVKRRLNKDYREDLCTFSAKDEKKAYLAKLFDEQHRFYLRLLGKPYGHATA